MWERYRDAPALAVRLGVFNNIQNATALNGCLDEADVALRHFRGSLADAERFIEPLCAMWEDTLRAFRGLTADSEEIAPERAPFLQADTTFAIWSYNIGARRQRLLGDRAAEHRHVAAALAAADRTSDALTVAVCRCDAAFSAWFWGDDAGFETHLGVLEACLTPRVERGFSFFVACARGRGGSAEPAFEEFKFRSFAYLLAAAFEPDAALAARYTHEAVIAADQSGQAFPRIVSRVAQALVHPSERERALTTALSVAEATESAALAAAVRGIAAGGPPAGMLSAFGARFAGRERRAPRALCVDVLTATVSVDGRQVPLRPREFLIVAALALVPGPLDSTWFTGMLWPQATQAANRFYVTLARLRAKLGAAAVTRSARGYALASHAIVDLDVMEARLRRLPRTLPLPAAEREELRRCDDRLRAAPPILADEEWLQPTQTRVERLRRDVETLLAQDASARSDHDDALANVERMVERDPCDEVACEIALRAWMAKGDRATALRCLREYEAVLRRELGVAPSRYLAELVEERG
jgi:DNA-binding SARP family transcriptional activator